MIKKTRSNKQTEFAGYYQFDLKCPEFYCSGHFIIFVQ